jgi:EpsI family protein
MKPPLRLALSVALLVGALLVMQLRSSGEAVPIRKSLNEFPMQVGGWQGLESTTFDAETLNILKAKDYVVRRYADQSGRSLWLYIGYWDTQRKGAQVHSPRNCLPGAGWEPLEASRLTIALPAPYGSITVNRYLVQKEHQQELVFYWYQSQGKAVASEVAARVDLVRNSITRNRTDGALVRLSGPIYGNAKDTTERFVEYVQSMYPVLHDYLPD